MYCLHTPIAHRNKAPRHMPTVQRSKAPTNILTVRNTALMHTLTVQWKTAPMARWGTVPEAS